MEDIEAVARALPQYDFLVVGQGSRGPVGSNIKIKSVPYDQIHTAYQSADLFFLPSRTTPTWEEQYGMCLVEAMACGVPIVATDTGAISEVVGEHEILVEEGDTAAMVESIDGALSYKCNVLTLSRAGRARAERLYDASKVARQLSQLYLP
jgi:glycosyltransferase involved in cell wall biosynthesis